MPQKETIIPKNAVGREKDIQATGVHGKFLNRVVTLLVISEFESSPGAPRACVDFGDPTAVFEIIPEVFNKPH